MTKPPASPATRRSGPALAKVWLVTSGFLVVVGFLIFSYRYLGDLAEHKVGTFARRALEEGTGFAAAMVVLYGVVWVVRHFPVRGRTWWRMLPIHAVAAVVLSLAHTTLMSISRHILFPAFGLGSYDYGDMRFRYPMEMANFLILYAMAVVALTLFDYYREARDRELAAAELQAQLAHAQLHNLQLQLQPHFLFNALNTISSVMYEDTTRADAMLTQLSDLLRQTLRCPDAPEVALDEEIEVLRLYLRIMQERFGDRLQVEVDIDPAAARAMVPQLLLQPLVENSIRHAATATPLKVNVHAAHEDGNLLVRVSDNGPGIANAEAGDFRRGVGLSNTQERLAAMYGSRHDLRFENGPDGGLIVTVRVPFRTAGERQ